MGVIASIVGSLLVVGCIVSVLHENTSLGDSRTSPFAIDTKLNTFQSGEGVFTDTSAAQSCPFGYDAKESPPATCPFLPTPIAIAPTQERTSKGCQCSSICGPSAPDFKCDWCYTKEKCGNFGISGHWDYCVWPAQAKFDAQDHATKSNQLWAKITDEEYVGKSAEVTGFASTLKNILTESMIPTFDDHMEVFPPARKKVIHVQGVSCAFRLKTTSKQFTGILEEGETTGVIRMGSAASLDKAGPGMFPGLGITLPLLELFRKPANFSRPLAALTWSACRTCAATLKTERKWPSQSSPLKLCSKLLTSTFQMRRRLMTTF